MSDYTLDWASVSGIDGEITTLSNGSSDVAVVIDTPPKGAGAVTEVTEFNGVQALTSEHADQPNVASLSFSAPITDVTFNLLDIDRSNADGWGDTVTIIARDVDGKERPVTFSNVTDAQSVDGNSITGMAELFEAPPVGVTISGAVKTLQIIHVKSETDLPASGIIGISEIGFNLVVNEDPDGYVDGTFDDDLIDHRFEDIDGDEIDHADALLPRAQPNDDVVLAGVGNDTVYAADGYDDVFGGEGNDLLRGGAGKDYVSGGAGDDALYGDDGADSLVGGVGDDTLDGGLGRDVLSGGIGIDNLIGDGGFDILTGGFGNDDLQGNDGDDTLIGGAGADTLRGGDGNDTLVGGRTDISQVIDFNGFEAGEILTTQLAHQGFTVSSGNPKTPVMVFDSAQPTGGDADLASDTLGKVLILSEDRDKNDPDDNAGGGSFIFDFDGPSTVHSLTLFDVESGATVSLFDDQAVLLSVQTTSTDDGEAITLDIDQSGTAQLVVTLHGSGAIDNLFLTIDNAEGDLGDTLMGGAGNDVLTGGAGADTIDGGDDRDVIVGGTAGDVVTGGTGSNTANDADDVDILDLRGLGPFRVVQRSLDADENSTSGRVEFLDADGAVTHSLAYAEIEKILGDRVNSAPIARDDTAATVESIPITVDVIANDEDPEGGALKITSAFVSATQGTVEIIANKIVFTPVDDFTGEAAINYTAEDLEGNAADAIAVVTVNEAPRDGTIMGTSGDDLIDLAYRSDPDDDRVDALDEVVTGEGPNDDIIVAGDGNDTVFAGLGDDDVSGGIGNDVLHGEAGADHLFGGGGDDMFRVASAADGAGDEIIGGEDPDGQDTDTLDLRGSGHLRVEMDPDDEEAGTVRFLDGAGGAVTGSLRFSEIENVIPCFTPGTRIATDKGERLVQDLREGDRVITRDNGIQEIRWVGRKDVNHKGLAGAPELKPVIIRAGALGNDLPERDMIVSPNHRMLIANDRAELYFEEREVLVSAKHLVGSDGIERLNTQTASYIHFMFDQHEVVLSDGTWSESFQPGDYTMRGIDRAQRDEIFSLFPELNSDAGMQDYTSARKSLKAYEARLLVPK
ncbi:Hint domain-containing protein [Nereida sp. NH-UV-3]|uniref:Hint domain-containing protein n=1 Tax=Nereida TaxID=282198 RepID=UPI0036F392C1